jgi:hypothetical protein
MKILSRVVTALAAIGCLSLSSCSSGTEGASEEKISNALAVEMDPGLEIEDIEIKATDSLGTDVNPRFRTRSKVSITYTEDFYRANGKLDGQPLVTQVAKAGDTVSGDVITLSTPQGDDWRVEIERLEFPPIQGQAASQFGNSPFLVEGSDEYHATVEKLAEADAKAEAERVRKVADLKARLSGAWVSSQPLTKNGAVYEHRGLQTGYRLKLDPADGEVGTGTATMYVYSRPDDDMTTDIGYAIDESGDFATITFNRGAYHRQLRTDVGRGRKWQLNADGQMTTSFGRDVWLAQLKKQ